MPSRVPVGRDISSSSPFRRSLLIRCHRYHIADWATVFTALFLYMLLEHKEPFHRMFSLDDQTLQHPFTESERVPNVLCLILAISIPSLSIFFTSFMKEQGEGLHLFHVSMLGLATSISFNGFITNFLKIWIGRPRPDLIARCIPASGTPLHELVTISVCTTTDLARLGEGFKSAPSGHSSTSFAAFLYLSLWICGQTSAFKPGNHTYKLLVALMPVLIAAYIAISRTEDYRHHPTDVISGTLLGSFVAYASYRALFPSLTSANCGVPYSASSLGFGKVEDNERISEQSVLLGDSMV